MAWLVVRLREWVVLVVFRCGRVAKAGDVIMAVDNTKARLARNESTLDTLNNRFVREAFPEFYRTLRFRANKNQVRGTKVLL